MSAVINKYYAKLEEIKRLQSEVANMEKSPALKDDLAFKAALEKLLDTHSKSAKDVAAIISGDVAPSGRKKRTASVWTNPHTGEKVETAGGNHKTLKEWREKYGADEVAKWKA